MKQHIRDDNRKILEYFLRNPPNPIKDSEYREYRFNEVIDRLLYRQEKIIELLKKNTPYNKTTLAFVVSLLEGTYDDTLNLRPDTGEIKPKETKKERIYENRVNV